MWDNGTPRPWKGKKPRFLDHQLPTKGKHERPTRKGIQVRFLAWAFLIFIFNFIHALFFQEFFHKVQYRRLPFWRQHTLHLQTFFLLS